MTKRAFLKNDLYFLYSGIHTGKGIAGIVGKRRPRLLVWGLDAARAEYMENHGTPGAIHVSEVSILQALNTLHSSLVEIIACFLIRLGVRT